MRTPTVLRARRKVGGGPPWAPHEGSREAAPQEGTSVYLALGGLPHVHTHSP